MAEPRVEPVLVEPLPVEREPQPEPMPEPRRRRRTGLHAVVRYPLIMILGALLAVLASYLLRKIGL